jgi:hypothetical protein
VLWLSHRGGRNRDGDDHFANILHMRRIQARSLECESEASWTHIPPTPKRDTSGPREACGKASRLPRFNWPGTGNAMPFQIQ